MYVWTPWRHHKRNVGPLYQRLASCTYIRDDNYSVWRQFFKLSWKMQYIYLYSIPGIWWKVDLEGLSSEKLPMRQVLINYDLWHFPFSGWSETWDALNLRGIVTYRRFLRGKYHQVGHIGTWDVLSRNVSSFRTFCSVMFCDVIFRTVGYYVAAIVNVFSFEMVLLFFMPKEKKESLVSYYK